jgi:hypothetical protein
MSLSASCWGIAKSKRDARRIRNASVAQRISSAEHLPDDRLVIHLSSRFKKNGPQAGPAAQVNREELPDVGSSI